MIHIIIFVTIVHMDYVIIASSSLLLLLCIRLASDAVGMIHTIIIIIIGIILHIT